MPSPSTYLVSNHRDMPCPRYECRIHTTPPAGRNQPALVTAVSYLARLHDSQRSRDQFGDRLSASSRITNEILQK